MNSTSEPREPGHRPVAKPRPAPWSAFVLAILAGVAAGQDLHLWSTTQFSQDPGRPVTEIGIPGIVTSSVVFVGPGPVTRLMATPAFGGSPSASAFSTITSAASFPAPEEVLDARAAPFDQHYYQDLLLLTRSPGTTGDLHAWVVTATGAGTFSAPAQIPLPPQCVQGELIHVDPDQRADLVAVEALTPPHFRIHVLANTWPSWTEIGSLTTTMLTRLQSADFGIPPSSGLAWFDQAPGSSAFALVTVSAATISAATLVSTVPTAQPMITDPRLAAGDLDADGNRDLTYLAANGPYGPDFVRCTATAGLLGAPVPLNVAPAIGTTPTLISTSYLAAGFNLELRSLTSHTPCTGCPSSTDVHLQRQTQSGVFEPTANYLLTLPTDPTRIRFADLDGDGDQDLVAVGPTYSMTLYQNFALRRPKCPTSQLLELHAPVPYLGNAGFLVYIDSNLQLTPAVFALSLGAVPLLGCGVGVDLAPGQLILPAGPLGVTMVDPNGQAVLALPIPASPALAGTYYLQVAAVDPQGGFTAAGLAFDLSDALALVVR